MILVITVAAAGPECVERLQSTFTQPAILATSIPDAKKALRREDCDVIVLDELLGDRNPMAAESLWRQARCALPVIVNFATSSAERVATEIRAALQRRDQELAAARMAAHAEMRTQLTGPITGILLSSELALQHPGLPPEVAAPLHSICELARELRTRLGGIS